MGWGVRGEGGESGLGVGGRSEGREMRRARGEGREGRGALVLRAPGGANGGAGMHAGVVEDAQVVRRRGVDLENMFVEQVLRDA